MKKAMIAAGLAGLTALSVPYDTSAQNRHRQVHCRPCPNYRQQILRMARRNPDVLLRAMPYRAKKRLAREVIRQEFRHEYHLLRRDLEDIIRKGNRIMGGP